MLRRKLLGIFGALIILLVAMAVPAIWLLQRMLQDLDHINSQAMVVADQTSRLNTAITAIEVELYELQLGRTRHLDALIRDVQTLRDLTGRIGQCYVVQEPQAKPAYAALQESLPAFTRNISSLATAQDPALAREYNVKSLADAIQLRQHIREIDEAAREHARLEQTALAGRFRRLVVGIAIGCLAVINITIIFLLRSASMILKPVDKLVEATRQLARERFDYRTDLDEQDEFHELAQAYNSLAERLQGNEQRKMEMLSQVALTLNHELNNAIATIELQLQVLGRQSGEDEKFKKCLRQIQENLQRMAQTVESLKHIRRIVLTDYIAGVKMLDLKQSIQDGPAEPPPADGALAQPPAAQAAPRSPGA